MKLPFGLQITRRKSAVGTTDLSAFGTGGWLPVVREPISGAWQRGQSMVAADVVSSGPVWACVTLIANDIAKLCVDLQQQTSDDIWTDVTDRVYTPVLRKPNDYQNRIQFFQSWLYSKLTYGNTYILKERNARGGIALDGTSNGNVRYLYPLNPTKVRTLITPDGAVYYQLGQDLLSGVSMPVVAPASEIIHDIYAALYHPLCGLPPLYASGLAASLGLKIRQNSSAFFNNRANLDGILVAPQTISPETAKRLEDYWNANYSGPENAGKIAALGDGLKFEPLTMTARDAQLSEQLKDAALEVCAAYHVPAWLVGYGPEPNYNNGESKYQQYYNQCLQILIESIELLLKEGLEIAEDYRVQFDVANLLRMDSVTQMTKITTGVKGGVMTPNEGRKEFNLPPLTGGDTVYLQQQEYSIEALAKRDASEDPFQSVRQTFTAQDTAKPPQADGETPTDAPPKAMPREKAVFALNQRIEALLAA
jgi:HK97 family phage portal protein